MGKGWGKGGFLSRCLVRLIENFSAQFQISKSQSINSFPYFYHRKNMNMNKLLKSISMMANSMDWMFLRMENVSTEFLLRVVEYRKFNRWKIKCKFLCSILCPKNTIITLWLKGFALGTILSMGFWNFFEMFDNVYSF